MNIKVGQHTTYCPRWANREFLIYFMETNWINSTCWLKWCQHQTTSGLINEGNRKQLFIKQKHYFKRKTSSNALFKFLALPHNWQLIDKVFFQQLLSAFDTLALAMYVCNSTLNVEHWMKFNAFKELIFPSSEELCFHIATMLSSLAIQQFCTPVLSKHTKLHYSTLLLCGHLVLTMLQQIVETAISIILGQHFWQACKLGRCNSWKHYWLAGAVVREGFKNPS